MDADLTQVADVKSVFDTAQERFGRPAILVNSAGMVLKKPFAEITEGEYGRMFAITAKAPLFCMQEAARRMVGNGRIVNPGTTLLDATTGFCSIYAGSKAPLEHFTRASAKEIGGRGITVNVIAPGPLNTSFFYPAETAESVAFLKHMSTTWELGEVSDIVPLVRFLVSPEARRVTARTICINGGFVAR